MEIIGYAVLAWFGWFVVAPLIFLIIIAIFGGRR